MPAHTPGPAPHGRRADQVVKIRLTKNEVRAIANFVYERAYCNHQNPLRDTTRADVEVEVQTAVRYLIQRLEEGDVPRTWSLGVEPPFESTSEEIAKAEGGEA